MMAVDRYVSVEGGKITGTLLWDAEDQPDFPEQAGLTLVLVADALAEGMEYATPTVEPAVVDPDVEAARAKIVTATTIAGLRSAVLQYLDASEGQ